MLCCSPPGAADLVLFRRRRRRHLPPLVHSSACLPPPSACCRRCWHRPVLHAAAAATPSGAAALSSAGQLQHAAGIRARRHDRMGGCRHAALGLHQAAVHRRRARDMRGRCPSADQHAGTVAAARRGCVCSSGRGLHPTLAQPQDCNASAAVGMTSSKQPCCRWPWARTRVPPPPPPATPPPPPPPGRPGLSTRFQMRGGGWRGGGGKSGGPPGTCGTQARKTWRCTRQSRWEAGGRASAGGGGSTCSTCPAASLAWQRGEAQHLPCGLAAPKPCRARCDLARSPPPAALRPLRWRRSRGGDPRRWGRGGAGAGWRCEEGSGMPRRVCGGCLLAWLLQRGSSSAVGCPSPGLTGAHFAG